MLRNWILFGGLTVVAATVVIAGCNNSETPIEKPATPQPGPPKPDDDHSHKPGSHGGILVSLGKDSYHAEAKFEKGRKVRLYMLGKEETRVQEVEAQDLAGFVTLEGSTESVPLTFKPEPQDGDGKGKTSLFVATLPENLSGKKVQITINNINIGGERFRIGFSNEALAHVDPAMPEKKASDDEKALFLTPGGKYTAADIQANGNTLPAVKFKGIRPTHDDNPKAGQVICPISKTLANPKFAWVVDGKTYQFCCIPCIEEFVDKAKEKPEEIRDPSTYIKK